MLRSSFLAYLGHATPYVGPGDAELSRLLEELIARQADLAQRIAAMIRELGSEEDLCDFPAEFTAAHDLGIRHVMRRAGKDQRKKVQRLSELLLETADERIESLLNEVVHGAEAIADQLDKATDNSTDKATQPATV